MHRASVLVFALFCTSLVAAAPVAPVSISSEVAAPQATPGANFIAVPVVPAGDIQLPVGTSEQSSEIQTSHAPESMHSAEKSRRRSFRRRHP
ncbi:hypothetical protein C8R46DRAFT_1061604 [Mycena filopes]|nr:hypothetical protein C8R46DRAFT_1061604 [Mycena filopes]